MPQIFLDMARNNSFIKLEGTLDGLTFYKKDGQSYVKTKSGVTKSRILNDPAYKRTRENMQEFAGGAKAGKALRQAYAGVIKIVADTYISARISGLMKRVINNGTGIRGARELDLVAHGNLFMDFEFNKRKPLNAVFFAEYAAPTLNANRDVLTWTVPDFTTGTFINAPEGASHFKLVLAAGLVSNYTYDALQQGYEPVSGAENGLGGVSYSAAIPLSGAVGSDTTLTLDLGIGAALPAAVASTGAIGIQFYQEINGEMYVLNGGHAMRIALMG